MKKEKLLQVLLAPHISEKSASSVGQYVFKVATCANKHDVKDAVESLFSVKVKAVNIARVKGATASSRMSRVAGKYASWKKAYVVLQAGQEINFA